MVKPGKLTEMWKTLEICVENDLIIIMQAANTGLTGGSTPFGEDYDRPIVIINTMRMSDIHLINDGNQIIGFSGSTLYDLEKKLKPLKKEPSPNDTKASRGIVKTPKNNPIPLIVSLTATDFNPPKIA